MKTLLITKCGQDSHNFRCFVCIWAKEAIRKISNALSVRNDEYDADRQMCTLSHVFIGHMSSYGQVDNYVCDWCHVTSRLYKTDTSLRRTVEAGPKGVHLREV